MSIIPDKYSTYDDRLTDKSTGEPEKMYLLLGSGIHIDLAGTFADNFPDAVAQGIITSVKSAMQ